MKHDQESVKNKIQDKKTFNIAEKMKSIWEFIKKKLANAQKFQKKYADRKRIISSEYVVENEVRLSIKNIKTKRSSKKLNHKWIESYKIKKVLKDACQLNLSQLRCGMVRRSNQTCRVDSNVVPVPVWVFETLKPHSNRTDRFESNRFGPERISI
jgi:hypothetical protein